MDYSLLVGVVRRKFEVMDRNTSSLQTCPETSTNDIFQRDADGGMHAAVVEGPGTYYMGIIDVLQEWNWEKKLERFFKIYFKWMDPDGLSAISPQRYVERFMKRCVVEVFDGLYVSDDDFNPKMRNIHGTFRQPSRAYFHDDDHFFDGGGDMVGGAGGGVVDDDGGERGRATGGVGEEDLSNSSLQLSVDRFRSTTGIDRRFSAAPLDNGNHSLQMITARGQFKDKDRPSTGSGSGSVASWALEEGLQTELE
jgi:hypothetical protein